MKTMPTDDQLWWTDVFANEERSRLHSSGDGCTVARGDPLALSAALGGPHLIIERCHVLQIAVAGAGWVVGVAEAEWPPEAWPWSKPAWGLSAWGQAPICCSTTLDVDEADGPEQLRTSGANEAQVLVEIRINPRQQTLQFVRDGSRLGNISCAPAQVLRPWAFFVPRSTPSAGDIATIVSHRTCAPPLFNVDGLLGTPKCMPCRPERAGGLARCTLHLDGIVLQRAPLSDAHAWCSCALRFACSGPRMASALCRRALTDAVRPHAELVAHLPDAKQSLALSWCESYGIDDLQQLSDPRHLVDALFLPDEDSAALLRRFAVVTNPSLPSRYS